MYIILYVIISMLEFDWIMQDNVSLIHVFHRQKHINGFIIVCNINYNGNLPM